MFTYYACVLDKRGPQHVYGFAIGSVMFFGTLVFGPYSGACVNPMRVFGIYLFKGEFTDLNIYFFSSLSGCLFGAFYYYSFLMKDEDDFDEKNNLKESMKTAQNYNLAQTLSY